jgi:hypothetical protein
VVRFPGGQTLYVELSSVDNLLKAVWVGFLEDKRCMLNSLLIYFFMAVVMSQVGFLETEMVGMTNL